MRPVKIMWPKAYCSCLTSLPSCHTARQCTVTNCLNIWIFLQKLISFYHTDRCDFKCFHKCDTYLLAVVMLCSIRDWWWWWGGGRRKTATEDLVFEYALNSELASSQRGACTHNVVVRCMVGILICGKWVGCSPPGWRRPCWLSVGDKTLWTKVGLHIQLSWNSICTD